VGAKSSEICFFPLETKKATFFAEIFKIQGDCSPSDAHEHTAMFAGTRIQGGEDPLKFFSPPLEKCVGHSLKKMGPSQKTLRPTWCPKLGLDVSLLKNRSKTPSSAGPNQWPRPVVALFRQSSSP